ncbi:MAG TPA: 3-hydroxyacyl-CoA dehydrogenase family protein [Hyphomicrobiaceae bacterium]|nr:3-hydroxyacyl-CoA dehydrogenase family protein [Hyphomicrobiaceae bacterium]
MSQLKTVGVLGAGTMGHALALVHAAGGLDVRMTDTNADMLARAPGLIASALDTLAAAKAFDPAERQTVLDRIKTVATLPEAVEGADLIVEAVVENADVKRTVYAQVDAAAGTDAILASNTSHLDVFPLIPERRQAQSAIAHWYTPPYICDLVDLAPGPQTKPEVIETLRALYAGMGKEPIVFKSMLEGYIANRLQAALHLEVFHLLDEGLVTADDVDRSIRHGLALRFATLGVLRKADFTGLDMMRRAVANKTYTPPEVRGESPTLEKLIAEGRTGVMSGAGFFDYGGRPADALFRERDIELLELKRALEAIEKKRTA